MCSEMFTMYKLPIHQKKHCIIGSSVSLQFDLVNFFEPFVRQWLMSVDGKVKQWVEAVSFSPFR